MGAHTLNKTKLYRNSFKFCCDITLDEYAELVGRGRNIVGRMCRNGRIPGARQQGSRWLIPEDAPYPASLKNNEE